jgi:hypothetical protein
MSPAFDIELIWRTHMSLPLVYKQDTEARFGKMLERRSVSCTAGRQTSSTCMGSSCFSLAGCFVAFPPAHTFLRAFRASQVCVWHCMYGSHSC